MNDITIKVDGEIREKSKQDVKKLSDAAKRGHELKGISDKKMGQIVVDIDRMQKILDKEKVTKKDVDEFEAAYKRVVNIVDEATRKVVKITSAAQKKLNKVEEKNKEIKAVDESKRKNIEDRNAKIDRFKEWASAKKTKEKISFGRGITNLDKLEKKDEKYLSDLNIYKDGKALDKNSTEYLDLKKQIDEIIGEYRKTFDTEKELNEQKKQLTEELGVLTAQYHDQNARDFRNGKNQNVDFGNKVMEASGAIYGDIGNFKDQIVKQEEKESLLSSDLKLGDAAAEANNFGSSLGKLAKQFSIWTIGLRLARKALYEVKRTVVELDKSLTEQAMVTGKTRKEVYGLLGSYQDLAIQLGSTTKEVSAAVTEFIRQGKSTQEAMTLAEAAISAAKVASINSSDSINYLTTALNGFQLSANQAMIVSDKFASVAANAATSYEEIAIALSKVASQANLAGMSIDYTTALLAKGLETTREAPETIGTALKTVIARMREITDYGETLEDGVDLNNVESQLAYVGIQLKTTSGELRSTEDVLDELGRKWDILNSNQQAAIAKALAGTRQQSRLIAMMSDYERVIELQEISARSAGATMAQMETYGQGLEAALNRLSTTWEKIVSTISNSDVIIFLVDSVTGILNIVNDIFNSTVGVIAIVTVLANLGFAMLNNKVQSAKLDKLRIQYSIQEQKLALKKNKINAESFISLHKSTSEVDRQVVRKKQATLEKMKQLRAEKAKNKEDTTKIDQDILELEIEIQKKEETIEQYDRSQAIVNSYDTQVNLLEAQTSLIGTMKSGLMGMLLPILTIWTVYKKIATAVAAVIILKKKENKETLKGGLLERTKAAWSMAGSAGKIPFTGWAIALAILAAIGISVAVTASKISSLGKSSDDALNELNASVFNLTKRATEIDTVIDKIEELDKNLIKTKKDTEELADALSTVADQLSSEEDENLIKNLGMSEQAYYEMLTDSDKITFLKQYKKELEKEIAKTRADLAEKIRSNGIQSVTGRLSARTVAKNTAYNVLDEYEGLSSSEQTSLREFLDKMVEGLDDNELIKWMENLGAFRKELKAITAIKAKDGSIAFDILSDEDRTLKEKVDAFKLLTENLDKASVAYKALNSEYREFNIFSEWNDDLLDLVDNLDITIEEINELYKSYNTVAKALAEKEKSELFTSSISQKDFQSALIERFLPEFESSNMNVAYAMKEAFGELIDDADVYNAILNQIAKTIQIGIQNISQNVDKLKSSVTSVYETVEKWDTMSRNDQSSFVQEHSEMFAGQSGGVLYEAFKSKDYQQIREALAHNKTLLENRENLIRQLEAELTFERSRRDEEYNAATVALLEDQLAKLKSEDFFAVDLETLVEQENKRIEAYKDLLQKEQDALEESLNKRKDAYQKYFEAINQSQEDEDYEEKAETLIANLTKLSGSTNATSKAQAEELQNSLAELEKERLQTLRERAQEAVIQSIDDTIDEINDKFDKLLETNRELLHMLNGTSGNELVAGLLSQESFTGKTANEAQLYLNEIQSTFGEKVSNIDWSQVSVSESGGNLTLNIGDQVIQLTGQEAQGRNIKEAILAALVQNGISVSAR